MQRILSLMDPDYAEGVLRLASVRPSEGVGRGCVFLGVSCGETLTLCERIESGREEVRPDENTINFLHRCVLRSEPVLCNDKQLREALCPWLRPVGVLGGGADPETYLIEMRQVLDPKSNPVQPCLAPTSGTSRSQGGQGPPQHLKTGFTASRFFLSVLGLRGAYTTLAWSISLFLNYLYHASNFFLYNISSREFRGEFVNIVTCRGGGGDRAAWRRARRGAEVVMARAEGAGSEPSLSASASEATTGTKI